MATGNASSRTLTEVKQCWPRWYILRVCAYTWSGWRLVQCACMHACMHAHPDNTQKLMRPSFIYSDKRSGPLLLQTRVLYMHDKGVRRTKMHNP